MASKTFKASWVAIYRSDRNSYYGTSTPVKSGGNEGFNSFIGFNSGQILDAIESSKTTPKVILHMRVTNSGNFDLGMHRLSSNTKTSTMPFYRYTGRALVPDTGWREYDITKFNIALSGYSGVDTFEEALKAGFQGIVLYSQTGTNLGEAYGVTNNSNHLYIEVQGTWNTKPGKPTITYPKAGVSVDGKVTLQGTAAKDSEQSAGSLKYQWRIYDGTWHNLSLGSAGTVNRSVDFSSYKETSAAKVSLRAYDGSLYGDWVTSSAFTINHNKPPSSPSNMEPKGGALYDRTQDIRFTWKHNDQDRQSKFNFRWRKKGASSWNTVSRTTTNNFYIAPAMTFPVGDIEWQVQTFDQKGLSSPYSSTNIFYATEESNAPIIVTPSQDEIVTIPDPVIQWSSVDQAYFEIEVLSGDSVIWKAESFSDVKGYSIEEELSNDTDYTVRVRVRSDKGLWSSWSEVDFSTSFTPPDIPEVNLNIRPEDAAIEVSVFNSDSSEGEAPAVAYNEVFRKVYGSSEEYKRVSSYLATNSYWIDYTPGSGIVYEYMVRSWGVNGAYIDSIPVLGQVQFKDSWLTLVNRPNDRLILKFNPSRSIKRSVKRTMMEFNGREFPVAEFGSGQSKDIDVSFDIRDDQEIEVLYYFLESKSTILYRDSRGRKEYVTIDSVNVDDKFPRGYTVSLTLNRVDYLEGLG